MCVWGRGGVCVCGCGCMCVGVNTTNLCCVFACGYLTVAQKMNISAVCVVSWPAYLDTRAVVVA